MDRQKDRQPSSSSICVFVCFFFFRFVTGPCLLLISLNIRNRISKSFVLFHLVINIVIIIIAIILVEVFSILNHQQRMATMLMVMIEIRMKSHNCYAITEFKFPTPTFFFFSIVFALFFFCFFLLFSYLACFDSLSFSISDEEKQNNLI